MKNRIMILVIIGILVIANPIFAQNTNPVVENVAFSISGTTVTVTYDVSDTEQNSFTVYMEVSSDGGTTWNYNYGTADGDIGAVTEGTGKSITWTYNGDYNPNFVVKILADDLYGDQIYYAGQIYNTVTIETQTWLKENLNVGTMINSTTSGFLQTDNGVIEKYCFNNDPSNCETYGGLYEWPEAMQYVTTEGAQGICPDGWHIPTLAEFQELATYVGDQAAKLIREDQPTGYTPTNETGFSALFAGYRSSNGNFYRLGNYTDFWSSTEYSSSYAYSMNLYDFSSNVYLWYGSKEDGFSVRCVQD